MRISLFRKWHAQGLIGEEALRRAEIVEGRRVFSLYWELRLLLYLGVLLLTGGLGVLVYKNIDTIGHQAVLAFIALVTAACFFYCSLRKAEFSWERVAAPDPFFDYVLLLGCLSLLIFLGYLQYEYGVFGDHYGLATFCPMVVLFLVAYFFDHLGALSLAIANLAAWVGVAITPLSILKSGNFANGRLILSGLLLAVALMGAGFLTLRRRWKAHFELTYTNFGFHLFFVAGLAGLFTFDRVYLLWFLGLMGCAWFMGVRAFARGSMYFLVFIVLYCYVALSYFVIRVMEHVLLEAFSLLMFYFIGSATGVALLLVFLNRKMKAHDRV